MLDKIICKSCRNQFVEGKYCNLCGEKVITQKDRKLRHFLGEFINALTFADSKLWVTLKSIYIAPGRFSSDYVEGKRRAYMKPVSFFFLANFLYFLLPTFNTFTTNLDIQLNAFFYSDIAAEIVQQKIADLNIDLATYSSMYDQKTAELSKILLILMAGILSLFLWPIHLGSKKNLLADYLTIGLELMTFILLVCIISGTIFLSSFNLFGLNVISDFSLTTLSIVLLTYFFVRTEKVFFEFKGIRLVINTILCLTSVIIAVAIYRMLLFVITFWSLLI